MENEKFIELGKKLSAQYDGLDPEDMYCVWLAKALQNNKGLFSTDGVEGLYFEVTYNGDKQEFYVDSYTKTSNRAVKLSEVDSESDGE